MRKSTIIWIVWAVYMVTAITYIGYQVNHRKGIVSSVKPPVVKVEPEWGCAIRSDLYDK